MTVYIDYYLDPNQKPRDSKAFCLNPNEIEFLEEAKQVANYCIPPVSILFTKQTQRYRVSSIGTPRDLTKFLNEFGLPFNRESIIESNDKPN